MMASGRAQEAKATHMPEIEILELTNDHIKFVLSKTDASMANSLRRIMIAEVPTLAIDKVTIYQNTSAMFDEFVAHRLGLVPLKSIMAVQPDGYKYQSECCSEGCNQCRVDFTLKVQNTEDGKLNVTTLDLKLVESTSMKESSDKDCVLPIDHAEQENKAILLMKLGKNQELDLDVTAIKGIGKEHAKWSPVAVATYQFDPDIRINQAKMSKLSSEERKDFIQSCPTNVYGEYHEQTREVRARFILLSISYLRAKKC
jgi:DNA-directed RNA polymerase II subunit RPB3